MIPSLKRLSFGIVHRELITLISPETHESKGGRSCFWGELITQNIPLLASNKRNLFGFFPKDRCPRLSNRFKLETQAGTFGKEKYKRVRRGKTCF